MLRGAMAINYGLGWGARGWGSPLKHVRNHIWVVVKIRVPFWVS